MEVSEAEPEAGYGGEAVSRAGDRYPRLLCGRTVSSCRRQASISTLASEDLTVEQFVAKRPIEAFIIAILPWRARRSVERLHADLPQPLLDGISDELGAIIGTVYVQADRAR